MSEVIKPETEGNYTFPSSAGPNQSESERCKSRAFGKITDTLTFHFLCNRSFGKPHFYLFTAFPSRSNYNFQIKLH